VKDIMKRNEEHLNGSYRERERERERKEAV